MNSYRVDNKALKKILVDKNIKTTQKLSDISGVNRNTCAKVLDDKIFPSSDVMARLATALHLDSKEAGKIFFSENLRNA